MRRTLSEALRPLFLIAGSEWQHLDLLAPRRWDGGQHPEMVCSCDCREGVFQDALPYVEGDVDAFTGEA